MRYYYGRLTLVLMSFSVFLPLLSCNARISGPLAADGSAAFSINLSLEPTMAILIQNISSVVGKKEGNVLDGSAISASMSGAPGISSISLRNTASTVIEGPIRISKISDFLAAGNSEDFITFEQRQNGGRCVIRINRNNGPEILDLLSIEIVNYLEAIMAPIATGEELTKTEYLAEVFTMYRNKALNDEIAGSRIRASIDFPGNVTGIKGGTFSGRRAEFNVPLLDLLVLETPMLFEVTW